MTSAHEQDGTHEAIEHFVRDGIGLAIQVVGHYKRQHQIRLQQLLRDGRDDRLHHLLETMQARDTLNKAVASTRWQGVHVEDWWQQQLSTPEGPAEIVDTYKDALTYADKDHSAGDALNAMNARFTHEPFNFNIDDLIEDGNATQVPDERAADAYADLTGKHPAQLDMSLGDARTMPADDHDIEAIIDSRAAEIMASLRDLQLSQALTTVGSPLSATDAVEAAFKESAAPQARSERGVRNPGHALDQGL
jgi:hypothetical protein